MDSDTKPTAKQIDYSPLTARVSLADMFDIRGQQGAQVSQLPTVPVSRAGTFVLYGVILMVLFLPAGIMLLTTTGSTRAGIATFLFFMFFSMAAGLLQYASANRTAIRLRQFAARNGLQFMQTNRQPPYQGMIFNEHLGSARCATNIVYSTDTPGVVAFEIGNYRYTTGSGKSSQQHNWVYIRMKMDRNLPHVVLDAKANNHRVFGTDAGTNLPYSFTKDQVLHLEGDFDKYFTLYAPKEYEDDALYVFAPDVMAMLIDESRQFDAEIVDNEAYFYLQVESGVGLDNQALMQQLIGIVTTLGNKLHYETEHYADDHIAPAEAQIGKGYVTTLGRSLKGTTWTSSAIANTAFIAIIILSFVAIFLMYELNR